jgi:hypothetical protein
MAMNYLQKRNFRHGEEDFWYRCEQAILEVAVAIKSEGGGVENHEARLAWAAAAMKDPWAMLTQEFRNAVATHPLVVASGSAIVDTNGTWSGLFDVVGSLINDFA